MRTRTGYVLSLLLAFVLVVPTGFAQDETPLEVTTFSQQELDQILAPIALYPDTLLSQMLMAATYPLEIVQAARWSKANSGLQGEAAVRAVDDRDWDPSVKSLVAFPQILSMMDEKLDWTEKLGDAFLAQQGQVMDTVQGLRQRAAAAGNLKSSDQYRVETQDKIIVVTSPNPEVVYVPYYDPLVVYGPWWWPAYRPVYWAPWPGYYARPGVVFRWSVGITIGHGFFFGVADWPHRHIRVVDARPFYYHRVHRALPVRHVWVHNYEHRRGVPYRSPAVQKRYVHANAAPVQRHDYSDRARQAVDPRNRRDGDRADHRRDADNRDGRGVTRESDRRVWSGGRDSAQPHHSQPNVATPKVDDARERVRAPVERTEPKRLETHAPAARPDPVQRPVIRSDGNRVREQRPERSGGERQRAVAQERAATVSNATAANPAAQRPGRSVGEDRATLNPQRNVVRDVGRQAGQQRGVAQPGLDNSGSGRGGRGDFRHSSFADRR